MNTVEPSPKDLKNLSELSLSMGMAKIQTDEQCAPLRFAYFPYSTTQQTYQKIAAISRIWQKLIAAVSRNSKFIDEVYEQIKQSDPMVSNLIRIKNLVQSNNDEQIIFLRNDYFMDTQGRPKIIQYNLTSVSMAAHSQNFQQAKRLSDFKNRSCYVKNEPMNILTSQIHELYSRNNLSGVFLMVVSGKETNVIEQRQIQIKLLQKGIKVVRLTLLQAANLKVDQSKALLHGQQEVSVVYYRTGYQLSDYESNPKMLWYAREIIEISKAIKIPNVTYDLINQKRVQVQLSKQAVYSQYLSQEQASLLKQSLVPVWQFDHMSEEQVKALIDKIQNGEKEYILKPNLEGGGHNIYGKEALDRLKVMDAAQRKKFIMMQKIVTDPIQNILVCCDKRVRTKCIYQVSQYGIIVVHKNTVSKSETCGFLIRIKPENENEGGIMAGVGSICSWIIE